MNFLRAFFLLFCVMMGPVGAGATAVVLDSSVNGQSLSASGQLFWLEDASGTLTLDTVREPGTAARFVPAPPSPHAALQWQPYWFKVELDQKTAVGDWLLATQTTALHDVRFYGPFDAAGRALAAPVHTGLSQAFDTRPLGSERYVARLQIPEPGAYTVSVRIVAGIGSSIDMTMWDATQYLQWRQHKRLFDGICYGILLALLIYNLVLTGVFRDRTYAVYIGQCAFALLTLASYNGHAASYLWGHWPWWQERANVVLPGIWLLFGSLFARHFLATRRIAWVDLMVRVVGALALLAAALGLAGFLSLAQKLSEVVATVGTLAGLVAAVVFIRRGFVPARWYLAGHAMLFLSVLGVVAVNWNLLDSPFVLANGLQIGVAAEMVVFAIALSSRIGRMQENHLKLRLHADHMAQAAATDPLTGLANRAGLAQGALESFTEYSTHSLMLLDLDRFKSINDLHGHDAGDAVLCAVARRLQAHTRDGDIVARLGGDEFVVLLAGPLPEAQLSILAQRLNDSIRLPVDFDGVALNVAVSIGIARRPQDAATLTELMHCADRAMYQAKQAQGGYAFYAAVI